MKLRALLLVAACLAAAPVRAGLLSDDEARQQVQQVGARVSVLEDTAKQQAETDKQQTHTLLDLQSQIDALNAQLRSIQGRDEELAHGLQDAEKRQKDFYLDLDTRLRHFETAEAAAAASAVQAGKTADAAADGDNVAVENRAYEAAHTLFKAGKYQDAAAALQDFLKKFPDSVYVPNAGYELGSAYSELKDYPNAMAAYRVVTAKYAFSPKAPDAMLGIASCQQKLKAVDSARKSLRLLISKYPDSEAAKEARKRLASFK